MSYLEKGLEIINKIEQLGYNAYIIGGAVRDYILKIECNDIDVTTNMPIEELKKYFTILENGTDYLSVTIIYDNMEFEITHYRVDISYENHRHPIVKKASTLKDDCIRRDFTINALAMDKDMDIIDYFNGIEDLNNGIIKTINNPDTRFYEDALRILRGLYFSSKLNFKIDNDTLIAMKDNKHLLTYLSNERIMDYFIKIAYAKNDNGINYIKKYDLFSEIPEYKWLLEIHNKSYDKNELNTYYYLKYNKHLSIAKGADKGFAYKVKDIIDSNFNKFVIYKNLDILGRLNNIFISLNYDIISISDFVIKSDNELALKKEEIAKMYDGKMITIAINEVIKAILDKRIANTKKDILEFLNGLDVVVC